jgi:hypothetical protein
MSGCLCSGRLCSATRSNHLYRRLGGSLLVRLKTVPSFCCVGHAEVLLYRVPDVAKQKQNKNFEFGKNFFVFRSQNIPILHLYILCTCSMPLPKGPGLNLRRTCVEQQLMIVLMRSIEAREFLPSVDLQVIWTRNDAGSLYFSSKTQNNLELPNANWLIPATSELFKLNIPRGFIAYY